MKTDLFVPSAAADRLASASGAHAGTDGTSDGSGPSGGGGGSNHVAVPSYVPVLFVVIVFSAALVLGWWIIKRLRASRSGWRGLMGLEMAPQRPRLSEVMRAAVQPSTRHERWSGIYVSTPVICIYRGSRFAVRAGAGFTWLMTKLTTTAFSSPSI